MHVGMVSCALEAPLTQVARLMAEHRIHCVVGVGDVAEDDTRVWGVITDGDLMAVAAAAEPDDFTARAAAATEGVMVQVDEPLRRAAYLMREHQGIAPARLRTGRGLPDRRDLRTRHREDHRRRTANYQDARRPGRGAHVVSGVRTRETDAPLREVAALLVERSISGVPVVRGGEIVGVVSEADIVAKEQASQSPVSRNGRLARRHRRAANDRLRSATTAGEVMSSPAITIAAWRPASAAAALMVEHGVKRLPVVRQDRAGRHDHEIRSRPGVRAFRWRP